MKKAFFVILASIALVSCIKEGPRGIPGKNGKDGTQINTYYFEVFPNQWKPNGDFGFPGYYCYEERTLAALTPSVIENGAVLVYVILKEQGIDYDHQLPYIKPSYDYSYDYGYYLKIIRYDLQAGKIGFIVEDSDFETSLPPYTTKITFKVVVISKI